LRLGLNHFLFFNYNRTYPLNITLPVVDPNLTFEGLSIAFGHLYRSFAESTLGNEGSSDELSSRYRATLAAVTMLNARMGKMNFGQPLNNMSMKQAFHLHLSDLATHTVNLIKLNISQATVHDYCIFLSQSEYAPWSQEIRDAVFSYLAKGAVQEAFEKTHVATPMTSPVWPAKDSGPHAKLVRVFANLPFDWLKKVVESKSFEVPSDMERFVCLINPQVGLSFGV
jgi:hypothetical protein